MQNGNFQTVIYYWIIVIDAQTLWWHFNVVVDKGG